jgi:hypothetical protein
MLPAIQFAMNTAHCESTGYSAAYLTFGRELRSPDDANHDLRSIVSSENFLPEITPRLIQLADTLRQVRNHNDQRRDQQKEYGDRRRRPDPTYKDGDHVLVNTHFLSNAQHGYSSKFAPRRDGPYVVLRKHGPVSYEVAHPDNLAEPLGVYHTSQLTPFINSEGPTPAPVRAMRKRGRPRKDPESIRTTKAVGSPSNPIRRSKRRRVPVRHAAQL